VTVVGDSVQAEVMLDPAESTEAALMLVVRLRGDLPLGSVRDRLRVRLLSANHEVEVPVEGQVVAEIVISPNCVCFGDVERTSTKPITRSVVLRRTDGKDLPRLVKVEVPTGLAVVEDDEAATSYLKNARRICLSLNTGRVPGDLKEGRMMIWLEGEPNPLTVRIVLSWRHEA
jgi:hypothetical protein